ncbi:hypothetical protein [Streptomyces chromofuscus]|uniref:Uncharacterized protein n=1 Tax=Streptomyces chromofuscus TaxID=42881 RepID=A0A7M2T9Z7_STRCW|nr:hypothetical protein [Streptomyces chromofuscus]QOV44753.1 hypothetical protein IPT68_01655 [Streptomyces chromofuscus]GGT00520.1 hypothetical protein GCM10010254_20780 [Streptomyces chromofuscus]
MLEQVNAADRDDIDAVLLHAAPEPRPQVGRPGRGDVTELAARAGLAAVARRDIGAEHRRPGLGPGAA